jgi:membrane-bound metal-dependent hydrolase YbcI (DUF457 family)
VEGHSHALSGACAGLAVGIALHSTVAADVALSGYTAGMALIPDLDSCGGSAARCFGLISGAVSHVVRKISGGHRHASHSLLGIAVFTGLAYAACRYRHDWGGRIGLALLLTIAVSSGLEALSRRLRNGHLADAIAIAVAVAVVWQGYGLALIPLATLVGCTTHIAGDMLTDAGCNLAWPLSRHKFHLLPEPFAFSTGTRPETLIVDPLLVASLAALVSWAVAPGADMAAWAHLAHFASTL